MSTERARATIDVPVLTETLDADFVNVLWGGVLERAPSTNTKSEGSVRRAVYRKPPICSAPQPNAVSQIGHMCSNTYPRLCDDNEMGHD